MKIRSIPHIYRNVKRWTEIISVLSRYGLADWISQLNLDFVKDHLVQLALAGGARKHRGAALLPPGGSAGWQHPRSCQWEADRRARAAASR